MQSNLWNDLILRRLVSAISSLQESRSVTEDKHVRLLYTRLNYEPNIEEPLPKHLQLKTTPTSL